MESALLARISESIAQLQHMQQQLQQTQQQQLDEHGEEQERLQETCNGAEAKSIVRSFFEQWENEQENKRRRVSCQNNEMLEE